MKEERMIELVQGQLDAYNARDVDKFCELYHPDVEVFKLSQEAPDCVGIEKFRAIYKALFEKFPMLHCELKSRIVINSFVIDEEFVTRTETNTAHAVAIYNFKDNLISKVRFVI